MSSEEVREYVLSSCQEYHTVHGYGILAIWFLLATRWIPRAGTDEEGLVL